MAERVESPLSISLMAASKSLRVDRILCAVTFAPSSRRMVAWAASLADTYGAELRLFHALPTSKGLPASASEADSERTLKKLFALAQPLQGRTRISAAVTEGDAVDEILRHARLVRADLIVIGTHAHDGSVSPLVTRIAIDAPCPVLAIADVNNSMLPPPSNGRPIRDLLCAVNFLPASLAAADYAFALARTVDARVTVVHVLSEHWEGPQRHDANVAEARQLVEHHFRQLLQLAVSEVSGSDRNSNEIVVSGRPGVEIVRLARARHADLIVLGIDAKNRSPDEFGGTTDCVLQSARSTVLLVPEHVFRTPRVRRRHLDDGSH